MDYTYTKEQVIQIIIDLLQRPDLLNHAMSEDADLWETPEDLFETAADSLGLPY